MKPDPKKISKFNDVLKRSLRDETDEAFDERFWSDFERRKDVPLPLGRSPIRAGVWAGCAVLAGVSLVIAALLAAVDRPVLEIASGGSLTRGDTRSTLVSGLTLQRGDVVRTSSSEWAILGVKGRFRVKLLPNSEVRLDRFKSRILPLGAVLYLSNGQTLVDITERGKQKYPFQINTVNAFARAMGTQFSVRAPSAPAGDSWIGVLNGSVRAGAISPGTRPTPVIVNRGYEVRMNASSGRETMPSELAGSKRVPLEEMFQFSKRNRAMLLIGMGPERVDELLKPAAIYLSLETDAPVTREIAQNVRGIQNAMIQRSRYQHQKVASKFERTVRAQQEVDQESLLLFIGAYYANVHDYEGAVRVFELVARESPGSSWASLALLAAAKTYRDKLHQPEMAIERAREIILRYPESLEAQPAKFLVSELASSQNEPKN